jgi:hypothetical protein
MDMDNLLGLGSALAAMRPDDGHRYDGTAILSALPDAPVVPGRRRPRHSSRTLLQEQGPLPATSRAISPTGSARTADACPPRTATAT